MCTLICKSDLSVQSINFNLVLKVLRLEGKRWSEGEDDNMSGAGSKLNLTSSESDADEQLRLSSSDLLS